MFGKVSGSRTEDGVEDSSIKVDKDQRLRDKTESSVPAEEDS